jgi:hypothetical protein
MIKPGDIIVHMIDANWWVSERMECVEHVAKHTVSMVISAHKTLASCTIVNNMGTFYLRNHKGTGLRHIPM